MQHTQHVTISSGNRKLGAIMNVSLTPIECCPPGVPCADEGCYALKPYRMYPGTRKAWKTNARIARTNPEGFFSQIAERIANERPRYFRWHVAGDILNVEYLEQMCRIAADTPGTRFLVFTKAFNIVNAYENVRTLPRNLAVIFSGWPGMRIDNPHGHRIAWMQDETEHRMPRDTLRCPGSCMTCHLCFWLPTLGRDVVFLKH